jgi:Flp pilus assembly pilin Flp
MKILWKLKLIMNDHHGQDLIDYALMAGVVGGGMVPGVVGKITTISPNVSSVLSAAGSWHSHSARQPRAVGNCIQ